ncbi:hypothetical protein [Methylocystis rosea]|uniref:Integrase catalytic domain-containing protein n=1 Tax=Methylocystis rosea TaxID=173366 RepID=A0A3G8M632_9HYPH|nr:hypothetical protein [Methylocystis rosea]AZG77187.1 hypothetical protein EHO51_10815 [Methylocystis rosea]
MDIRQVHGRGGKAGVQYQVRVDSLPIDVQDRLKVHLNGPSTPVMPRTFATHSAAVLDWFSRFVEEVEATKPGSVAHANILRAWSGRPLPDIKGSGTFRRYSTRSLNRFLADYQCNGVRALCRAKRSDHRTKRTIVTVKFDAWVREVGLGNELEPIAEALKTRIRGWHKASEGISAIRLDAERHLEKLVRERGFEPPNGACAIPLHIVKAESKYRAVAKFKKDRKAWQDSAPAIRRTIDGLAPMDIIVGDVHPLDFLLPEVEGFQRYAKAICWLDVATKRLWMTVVFLPKGTGIRNAHVIASFMEMASARGLPKTLYLDNGSEYNFAEFIPDAMKLAGNDGERVLIRAKPYNARAKAIEGVFAILRHLFAKIPGYIGGDRMKSKVANIGKAPVPFNGTFGQFREIIGAVVMQYHALPQRGQLKGLSPIEAYNRAVGAGWHMTEVDPDAFFTAFSTRETRVIKNDCSIDVGGRSWTCRELRERISDRVTVRIPKFEQWDRLPLEDERGNLIGFAEEAVEYRYFDPAGARASAKQQRERVAAVRRLDRSAPDIDVIGEVLALANTVPKMLPAPIGARVTASDSARAIARGAKESPKVKRAREDAARESEAAFDEDFIRRIQGAKQQ